MTNLKTTRILFVLGMFVTLTTQAQLGSGFGFKAGVNYGSHGDYVSTVNNTIENPELNMGYHIGVFGKIGNSFYVRPEVVYTKTKSDYSSSAFDMSTIDVPVLVGTKIFGPVSVFAGPAFQYVLNTEFEGFNINTIENDFSVGFNFGVALNFKTIGIDLRYERGFTENEVTLLDNNNIATSNRIDARPEQLILSLSVKL